MRFGMEVGGGVPSEGKLVPRDSKEPLWRYKGLNLIERMVVDERRLNTSISPNRKIPTWLDARTHAESSTLEFL